MAENEILDVKNSRAYRRWRSSLADIDCPHSKVAECLMDDLMVIFKKKTRGRPLYEILRACERDPDALRAAVGTLKDRELKRLIRNGLTICGDNTNPVALARTIVDLIVDQVRDRAASEAAHHPHYRDHERFSALDQATSEKLETCRTALVSLMLSTPVPKPRRSRTDRPTARTVVARSLRMPHKNPPGDMVNV